MSLTKGINEMIKSAINGCKHVFVPVNEICLYITRPNTLGYITPST